MIKCFWKTLNYHVNALVASKEIILQNSGLMIILVEVIIQTGLLGGMLTGVIFFR